MNNIDVFLDQIEDKKLSELLRSMLAYKADYNHNHDEKYAILDTVYTKEEIDIINKTTVSPEVPINNINDNIFAEINSLKSKFNDFYNNFSYNNQNDFIEIKKEINFLKKENLKLAEHISKIETELSKCKNDIKPLIERKNALIFSADNIINMINV